MNPNIFQTRLRISANISGLIAVCLQSFFMKASQILGGFCLGGCLKKKFYKLVIAQLILASTCLTIFMPFLNSHFNSEFHLPERRSDPFSLSVNYESPHNLVVQNEHEHEEEHEEMEHVEVDIVEAPTLLNKIIWCPREKYIEKIRHLAVLFPDGAPIKGFVVI